MRFSLRRRSRDALVCREAVALVADLLDDALPPDDAARLLRHLAGCEDCSEYVAQVRIARELARRTAAEHGSPDGATRQALTELYREWREG